MLARDHQTPQTQSILSTEPTPELQVIPLGDFQTNCYIVRVPGHPGCWLVDVGYHPAKLLAAVHSSGLRPEAILLTHAHCDHIAGIADARKAFPGIPVWLHPAERSWLADPALNLSEFSPPPISIPGPDHDLADNQTLQLGPTTWRVIHTPGHSPGGVGFYHAPSGTLIGGDTLFAGSVGRYDFPGSDGPALARSIREKLFTLPDQTRVHPGHGPATTIGHEKRTNPMVPVQ